MASHYIEHVWFEFVNYRVSFRHLKLVNRKRVNRKIIEELENGQKYRVISVIQSKCQYPYFPF